MGKYANYFKIAFGNLSKNKGYTFINIAGLATGMAVALPALRLSAMSSWTSSH